MRKVRYEESPDEITDAPVSEPFSTRKMKMLSRPDGLMLYGKLGVDISSTSEMLYPKKKKIRLRLIRDRTIFYMISDNPNVSLVFDCSLDTRRIALEDDCQKKKMDMLAYTPVGFIYMKALLKAFIISAGQNLFIQQNTFKNAPDRRIVISMNANSSFTGSYTENTFRKQQFDLRQSRKLRRGQPIVNFDAAYNCSLYVTTMSAMNFQDDIQSFPIDNFIDQYVFVFELTPVQDATENCHHPELVGEPLTLELNFTFPLEHVTELIVLEERMSPVAVDKFGVVGKNIWKWTTLLSGKHSIVSSYQVSVPCFIPFKSRSNSS